MIRNYCLTAIRNLLKHKSYSFINIAGLALGLTCTILILLFIRNEFSFDRHHPRADRIYRVLRESRLGDQTQVSEATSGALVPAMREEIPEVEQAIRFYSNGVWVRYGDKGFNEGVALADQEIFDVFDIPFVLGNPQTALREHGSIVIGERMAKRLFGDESPIGKTITLEDFTTPGDFTITGVFATLPHHSTIWFDALTTTPTGPAKRGWDRWIAEGQYRAFTTYFVLREGVDIDVVEAKVNDLMRRYMGDATAERSHYRIQPLLDVYLYSMSHYGMEFGWSDIRQVYTITIIGVFILIIALVNYTNLATARSAGRAREIGMRKVEGATRNQLVWQLLSESILTALICVVVALGLVWQLLPTFNQMVGRNLAFSLELLDGVGLVGLAVLAGLLGGLYPALYLSRFEPVEVIKGSVKTSRGAGLRKILVVVQFIVSTAFIIGTVIVYNQLEYIRSKDLGFEKDRTMAMPIWFQSRKVHNDGEADLRFRHREVKARFERHSNILMSTSNRFYQGAYVTSGVFQPEGSTEKMRIGYTDVDEDFVDFFGLELVAGRALRYEDLADQEENGRALLINESAMRHFGWGDPGSGTAKDPVGKVLMDSRQNRDGERTMSVVVGVLKDYHTHSLRDPIRPVAIGLRPYSFKYLYLKFGEGDLDDTIAFVEKTWNELLPQRPFEFIFMEDQLNEFLYNREQQLGRMFSVFAILAIAVACLGLFGLIAFMTEQRTKEIGIRKVLAASVSDIVVLMSKVFPAACPDRESGGLPDRVLRDATVAAGFRLPR